MKKDEVTLKGALGFLRKLMFRQHGIRICRRCLESRGETVQNFPFVACIMMMFAGFGYNQWSKVDCPHTPTNGHNQNFLDAILKAKKARLGIKFVLDQGGGLGNRECEFRYFENEAAVDGVLYIIATKKSKLKPEFMRGFQRVYFLYFHELYHKKGKAVVRGGNLGKKTTLVQLIHDLEMTVASKN